MNKLPQIYQCLDDSDMRPAMNYALIQKDETAATNAHILVVHASSELFDAEFLESLPDDGLMVGKEALKDLSKSDIHSITFHPDMKLIEVLHVPGRVGWGSYKRYFEVKLQSDMSTLFPKYKTVFPSKDKKKKDISQIGLHAGLLLRLQKAMGASSGVKMEFYGEDQSIICHPKGGDYSFCKGIIMPVII